VAVEIAKSLKAPLDLVLVRKIGVPFQPELAAAAVVDGGEPLIVVNDDVINLAGLDRKYIGQEAKREFAEIDRRREVYLGGRLRVPLEGRTLIVIDDGIATGVSIRAALKALRRRGPFFAIGIHYGDFRQLSDEDVVSKTEMASPAYSSSPALP
jgi:putative phosphoribosyl transferase